MRRLAELSSLQIVHEIRYPIGPAAKVVHADSMCQGAGNDQFASFRLNFCRGRIVLFFSDAKMLFLPAVPLECSGEFIQLYGVNELEGRIVPLRACRGLAP